MKSDEFFITIFAYMFNLHNNIGKENGNPLQYSCLENAMDGGAW